MRKSLSSLHYIVFAVLALFSAIIINPLFTSEFAKAEIADTTSTYLREISLKTTLRTISYLELGSRILGLTSVLSATFMMNGGTSDIALVETSCAYLSVITGV